MRRERPEYSNRRSLLFVVFGTEGVDLLLDACLALGEGKLRAPVLFALGGPVLGLLGGLESGVLTNRSICVSVDLLNVLRTYAISKV